MNEDAKLEVATGGRDRVSWQVAWVNVEHF